MPDGSCLRCVCSSQAGGWPSHEAVAKSSQKGPVERAWLPALAYGCVRDEHTSVRPQAARLQRSAYAKASRCQVKRRKTASCCSACGGTVGGGGGACGGACACCAGGCWTAEPAAAAVGSVPLPCAMRWVSSTAVSAAAGAPAVATVLCCCSGGGCAACAAAAAGNGDQLWESRQAVGSGDAAAVVPAAAGGCSCCCCACCCSFCRRWSTGASGAADLVCASAQVHHQLRQQSIAWSAHAAFHSCTAGKPVHTSLAPEPC